MKSTVIFPFLKPEFLTFHIELAFSQVILSQTTIIRKQELLVCPLLLLFGVITNPLHTIKLELYILLIFSPVFPYVLTRVIRSSHFLLDLHIDILETKTQMESQQVERSNKILEPTSRS